MAEKGYLVLARKWRPQRFEDVVGQEHITRTLKNAITSGRIHHAFLFIGSRGIGKTTTARILAKALNCLSFDAPTPDPCGTCDNCTSIGSGSSMDVIEIDGASNNGVDDIREIRDNIRMVPSNGRYKVYIIDEVHQLSSGAFNALLKTLEEPPPHAIFVLATTEAHKIPATVISRCQRYDFRRVDMESLIKLLRLILDKEGIKAADDALYAIARSAEGGVRDAESILDELITYCEGEITYKDVFDVLGLVDWRVMHALCEAILEKDIPRGLLIIEEVVAAGKDLSQFVQDILRYFRNLLVYKSAAATDLLHLPEEELREVEQRAAKFSLTQLIRLVEQFAQLSSGFDSQLAQRIALEALLIRISKVSIEMSVDAVLEKLLQLGGGGQIALDPGGGAPKGRAAPVDPPPAGATKPAPAAPAPPRRPVVSAATLAREWPRILEQAAKDNLNARIWFSQGQPVGIEGDSVIIEFAGGGGGQAQSIVERPENRALLENALSALTENLRTFQTRQAMDMAPAPESAAEAAATHYGSVSPDLARQALEDPQIAMIVDVFKGRIAGFEAEPVSGGDEAAKE